MNHLSIKYQSNITSNILCCLLFFYLILSINETKGQVNLPNTSNIVNNQFSAFFSQNEITFEKGEMISNVIKIANSSNKSIRFYIDLSIPNNWRTLNKTDYVWEVASGDSIFIPIRILPMSEIQGNTRYLFNAFIIAEDGQQLGYSYFFASTKKQISWDLTASDNKIYFLNGQKSCRFSYSLFNKGSEDQDILISMNSISKNAHLSDTLDQFLQKKYFTINLKTNKDTVFYLKYNILKEERNIKMIDLEGYEPHSLGQEQKYTLFINSSAPNASEQDKFRASDKIDFIKLNDQIKVNPYGSNVVPLIADLNAYNLLGDYPIMNLHLRGTTFINENSSVVYSTQLSYFASYYTNNPIQNAPFFVGYFHKKGNIQVGNISGGVLGVSHSGKGIKGEYVINKQNKIGAFYTNGPGLFRNVSYNSMGLTHQFQSKGIRLNTQYGHSTHKIFNRNTDVLSLSASFNVIKDHSFGVRLGGSRNFEKDSSYTTYGYLAGANYSGSFFKRRLATNLNGIYFSNNFGVNSKSRLTANSRNEVTLNKNWTVSLNNNYYRYQSANILFNNSFDKQLNNQLLFSRHNSRIGSFTPLLFYNYSNIQNFRVHSRGAGLNLGKFDLEKNNRYFVNFRAGYNHSPDILKSRDYFFFQFASLIQHKTVSFLTRYSIGNMALSKNYYASNSLKNPQFLSLSLRHQYVFSNPSFVLQNAIVFSYSTSTGKNITLNPDLYYFTRNGWRFRVYFDLNLSLNSQVSDVQYYIPSSGDESENNPEWTKSFNIGVGIRKEFGIPIPRTKELFATTEFIAFLDINGNKIKDKNEEILENIVIRLDSWEVITNDKGSATMENIKAGTYPFTVFSLANLNGWFPKIEDTLIVTKSGIQYVPFTRGVKISGTVVLQKDRMNANIDKPMDLSRIKITATNGLTHTTLTDYDGNYTMYIPYGTYILTLDEKMLGECYQLLQNNFELNLSESYDNIFIPFYIIEKKRKVKMTKFSNGLKINSSTDNNGIKTENNKNFEETIDTTETINYIDKILNEAPIQKKDSTQVIKKEDRSSNIPVSEITNQGTIFMVCLFEKSKQRKNIEDIAFYSTLEAIKCINSSDGMYLYCSGTFEKYKKAQKYLDKVKNMGYSEAIIIGFRDGMIISTDEMDIE